MAKAYINTKNTLAFEHGESWVRLDRMSRGTVTVESHGDVWLSKKQAQQLAEWLTTKPLDKGE